MELRILPGNIANMIAAGEVVQRPASVVKELMENAVDAGAENISVIIEDAGRTLIQVMDDGCGMSPDDAVLCFERHATSKIATVEDLTAIQTFGFRGEALASISAVAQVTLKTRRAGDELGCEVLFEGSQHISTQEISAPVGSNFAVRNLFYNIPARRKFMKSDNVEMKHIVTEFLRIALTWPQLNLTLTSNGRDIYVLKKAKSLKFRIQDLLGGSVVNSVVDISTRTSVVNISGYVGRPDAARKTQANQYFFVNGRYFRSPYFHKAVMNAYSNLLPEGAAPSYFIYLEVDPMTMDVNISPTKTEVKFEEDNVIFQTLYACIKEALGKSSFGDAIDFDTEGAPEIPVLSRKYQESHEIPDLNTAFNPDYNPFDNDGFPSEASPYSNTLGGADVNYYPRTGFSVEKREDYGKLFEDKILPSTQTMVLKGKYIFTPVKSGVMIVNIKRARERILYEENMRSIEKNERVTSVSLFPVSVRIGAGDMYLFEEYRPVLEALGFDIAPQGTDTVSVRGVPEGFLTDQSDVEKMLPDLILALSDDHVSAQENMISSVADRLARLGSVNSAPVRSQTEAQSLIDELFACENSEYTHSGHRIVSVLSEEELARMFN